MPDPAMMLPAFTTVTALPAVNPVMPADRAAALVGDAAAGVEVDAANVGPRDAAGIHHVSRRPPAP